MLATAFIAAHATGANPRGSGDGVTTVVSDSGEPSLTMPLLVLAVMVIVVVAMIVWWRRFGGWSPAEMTITLQLTGRDVELLRQEIDSASVPSAGATAAYERANAALARVLRRRELGAVQDHLAEARRQLEFTGNSQNLPVQPTSDHAAEFLP